MEILTFLFSGIFFASMHWKNFTNIAFTGLLSTSCLQATVSVGLFVDDGSGSWDVEAGTPSPYDMSVSYGNTGDFDVSINGSAVSFSSGLAATASAVTGYGADNYVTAFRSSGNLSVSTADSPTGGGTLSEQSSDAALAFFPFSDGWYSANMINSTVASGNTTGLSFSHTSTGTYTISGLDGTGNLLAFAQGNQNTNSANNSYEVTFDGSDWIIESYDNSGSLEDAGDWGWIYIPSSATGIYSGILNMDTGETIALNGAAAELGLNGSDVGDGRALLTLGDGTLVNPDNAALFLVGNGNHDMGINAGDDIYSYTANGNSFDISALDNPNQSEEESSVRFFILPYDTITAGTAVPEPSHFAFLSSIAAMLIVTRRRHV